MKSRSKMTQVLLGGGVVLLLVFALVGLAATQVFAQGGTWETKEPMPTGRHAISLGAHGNIIYAAGGWNGFHRTAVEAYDTVTNTWSTKTSMLGPQTTAAFGVINGVLYLAGGTDCCVEINTVTAYDIATNSWAFKLSMPTTRQGAAAGVINGKLYVAGGVNSQNLPGQPPLATLEAFDPATNAWSSLAPMPTARWFSAGGVVNGILYVVGGGTSSSFSTSLVEAYDPTTNTWTTKAPMPTARREHTVAVVNGILYVIGGFGSNVTSLSTVEAYDPVTNTWTTKTPMPTARTGVRAETVGGTLYAIGGYSVTAAGVVTIGLTTNEAFTPATTEIQVSIDIKPGSFPNSINLKSKGTVAVAILGTPDFNVDDVAVNTVEFAGAAPVRFSFEDVNLDGHVDLVFHFLTQELELTSSDTEATLTGETLGGIPFTGTDSVRIVK